MQCPHCSQPALNGFVFSFMFSLLLEDDTGYLNVIIYGKDGESLFGSQAVNLYENHQALKDIEQKMKRLCPSPGAKGSGNLCSFCVKSFSAKQSDLRSYRVFDTLL